MAHPDGCVSPTKKRHSIGRHSFSNQTRHTHPETVDGLNLVSSGKRLSEPLIFRSSVTQFLSSTSFPVPTALPFHSEGALGPGLFSSGTTPCSETRKLRCGQTTGGADGSSGSLRAYFCARRRRIAKMVHLGERFMNRTARRM